MQWFKRHPEFLRAESGRLSNDSNYKEIYQVRDNIFLSHGHVIVRLDRVYKHPILIIYTDATPYQLPLVFPLSEVIDHSELEGLASLPVAEVLKRIAPKIKYFHEYRHQNIGGSICFLEWDNLDEGGQFYAITTILKRLRDWYAAHITGSFPKDNQEVEYCAHFTNVNRSLNFLYPKEFLDEALVAGQFYATLIRRLSNGQAFIFYGCLIDGINKSDVYENNGHYLFTHPLDDKLLTSYDFQNNQGLVEKYINENRLLTGLWFHIETTLPLYSKFSDLLQIIGGGSQDEGIRRFAKIGTHFLKTLLDDFIVGIRYPNKRGVFEFQLFKVYKKKDLSGYELHTDPILKMKAILDRYEIVEAIPGENLSAENYHVRNGGRADYNVLRSSIVNLFGVGALGGEIADSLAKAGVGSILLVDGQEIKPHNPVRHLAGLGYVGNAKTDAVKEILLDHNPFIDVGSFPYNIFPNIELVYQFPKNSVIVSSIADDNTEGYVNEHAVISGRTAFYARALRGGKVGRIFKVKPGDDACFHCINLYISDRTPGIEIEKDIAYQTIRNECNNPVRPASAADLKIIAAITSRIVIDYLQGSSSKHNHWIWSTEVLDGIGIDKPFSLTPTFLPPHPKCFYCNHEKKIAVSIENEALTFMQGLVQEKHGLETGGVLAGFVDENGSVKITRASGPGPKAIHKKTEFKKDVEFCQQFLDGLYRDSDRMIVYVGEWHSHPASDNSPSGIDIKSLADISIQKEYLTTNPTMIILSNAGAPSCSVHPAGKRHYFTDLKIVQGVEHP